MVVGAVSRVTGMPTHAELFELAHQAHVNWQVDRPLIDKFNHSDLKVALKLLGGEIEELNGGDKTGIFSAANIENDHRLREDYRQQEIADIIIFAMTSFDELGQEINTAGIYEGAQRVASSLNFDLVKPGRPMDYPKALSPEKNQIYLELRQRLNIEADFLLSYDGAQPELLQVVLENVLIYAVAMHSLLGVDSGRAVLEKVARNMLKYPAQMFELPEGNLSPEALEREYDQRRAEAARIFDGELGEYELIDGKYQPLDRSKQAVLDPENVIIDRPKTGTNAFYQRPEIITYERGEVRQIGILYRAIAQVIASTYGYSVKVSNLLNRD